MNHANFTLTLGLGLVLNACGGPSPTDNTSLINPTLINPTLTNPSQQSPETSSALQANAVINGLNAEYFDTQNFSGTNLKRLEPTLNFNWANGSPASSIGPDTFSARYTAELIAPSSGTYRFYLTSDDGARLSINSTLVINDFNDHAPRTVGGSAILNAGQRNPIKLEYYEASGGASLKLEWSGPGVARQVIPTAQLFATPALPPVPVATGKKLIELGWDSPTPDFVRANITKMEQRPFDGVVLRLNAGKTIFNKSAYTDAAYTNDRADLSATKFSKLNQNFISIWAARETGWSWFNDADWNATATNAKNFAKTAKAGGIKGFFFDPEPYGTNPWSYSTALYPNQSFANVQAKVRQRGAAFLNAIQTEMPDVKILTLFGMTYIKKQAQQTILEQVEWTLLASFIDGMLDVINPRAQLIDGNEASYYYYLPNAQEFDAFKGIKNAARTSVSAENRAKYNNQVKTSHAVFIDGLLGLYNPENINGLLGCHLRDTNERQLMLEHHTYHALRTSDEYVWAYNERMNWWGSATPNLPLPNNLETILARAKAKATGGQPLGLSIEGFLPLAAQRYARTWNGEPNLTCLP
jgi:PA14 domain